MHLVYPSKFCITIVSNSSWVLQSSQEKSKTMVMQTFGGWVGGGGEARCIIVYVKMVNCKKKISSITLLLASKVQW